MSRTRLLTIGGVVLAAILIAGGIALFMRQPSTSSAARSSSSSAQGASAASKTPAADASATTVSSLKPYPPMADTKVAAKTLTSPAAAGAALGPLTGAPGTTISALKIDSMPDGTAYTVTVRPFGFGPSSVYGSRMVVRIDKITPQAGAPTESRFANANILVVVDTTHNGALTKGGSYDATLTFRSDGQKLVPVLSEAQAK